MTTDMQYHWLLRPLDESDPTWEPWYNKCFGFVIAAPTEDAARKMANDNGGDECGPISEDPYRHGGDPWLDPLLTSCIRFGETLYASPKVVIRDFRNAYG